MLDLSELYIYTRWTTIIFQKIIYDKKVKVNYFFLNVESICPLLERMNCFVFKSKHHYFSSYYFSYRIVVSVCPVAVADCIRSIPNPLNWGTLSQGLSVILLNWTRFLKNLSFFPNLLSKILYLCLHLRRNTGSEKIYN